MHVGVVGLNHRLAELNLREMLAKTSQRRFGPGCSVHIHHDFVLLSTCNRTEIYFSSVDLTETHKYILSILRHDIGCDFEQKLYSFFDEDCFQHLARVTSGLDSAIVFETEIQGQVKVAYERACQYSRLSHHLHFLFQKCLRVAKKVRSGIPVERGVPDVEHAILNTGKHFFSEIEGQEVLFIGASNINMKILHFLKNKDIDNITLCNRTDTIAWQVAEKYNLKTLSWNRLDTWQKYDWVIFGTKSPDYLITNKCLENSKCSQKLIIDLCVPRNVDPYLGKNPQVTLLNIDQINRMLKMRKKQIHSLVTYAESVVNESSERQVSIFRKRESVRVSLQSVEA
jgi:glutamyl-tRNA reductase